MKFYRLSDAMYVQHGKAADGRVKFQARIGMAPRDRLFSERNGLDPNPPHDFKVGPLFVSWWINKEARG